MAVPKKRTSSARRDKRRAQHKAGKPSLRVCPRCHSPRIPHRVCPTCGTYKGREVILCCNSCVKKFNRDPEKYVAILDAAAKK